MHVNGRKDITEGQLCAERKTEAKWERKKLKMTQDIKPRRCS